VSKGQTAPVGLQIMNRAFSRFAHMIGYVFLCGAFLDLLGYLTLTHSGMLLLAIIPLVATFVCLVFLDRRRTAFFSGLFLVVGGISQLWFAVSILLVVPGASFANTPALSLVSLTLLLVSGPGFVPSAGIVWSFAGFTVGGVASVLAQLQAGVRIRPDVVSIAAELGLLLMLGIIAVTRTRRLSVRPELDRAVKDEELADIRYRIEVRAAALMHDMVLNHLAAIASEPDGAIRPELRRQIEKDLENLIGEDWLDDPSPELDSQARTGWRNSALQKAVQEARDLSLAVDVTGDLPAVARLAPECDVALGLAVKQCLVNVLRHAQVESAEVVIIGSDTEVSVMVIDAGRGFSEAAVASDRLGLRQSVHRRIESVGGAVQVWSTPGRGTSVMIRVPVELREGGAAQ
jgi:signal transduction histidine kinase